MLASAAAAGMLLGVGAGQAGAEIWYEPHRTPGAATVFAGAKAVPLASPRWTVDYGRPSDGDSWSDDRIVASETHAYYIQNGKLVALELSSGRRVWAFGADIASIAYADDAVYALTETGALSRLSASTGAERWRTQIDDAADAGVVIAEPGTVYVKYAGGLNAIDADTGHWQWRNTDAYSYGTPVPLRDIVLFATAESGAITLNVTYGIDKATGRTLWRAQGVPLQVRSDVTYLRDTYPIGDDERYGLKLDVISTATGESLGFRPFLPLPEGRDRLTGGAERAVVDGDDVIAVSFDDKVYRTHLDADPNNVSLLQEGSDFAGPFGGKLFFAARGGVGLYSRDLFDNARLDYNGLDNLIGRLDVHGNGLFVGQTDGELFVFDVSTGRALFRYETGAKHFGPFRVVGGVLLVQTEEKLYAFDLPAELRPGPKSVLTPVLPKADASLCIDGAARQFEPSPVMIDNRMFVPLRALFQAVGAKVDFDDDSGNVNVAYGDRAFTLREGAPFALVGGKQQALSYAPALVNGAVYVPLRDVGGLLGVEVLWANETRTVEINTQGD